MEKPQTRNNSKTNPSKEKGTSKIEQLKNEIRILKQIKQYNTDSNHQSTSSTSKRLTDVHSWGPTTRSLNKQRSDENNDNFATLLLSA